MDTKSTFGKISPIFLFFLLTIFCHAQQPVTQQAPAGSKEVQTFKARTELVLVPTSVEKGNKPVLGLSKDNFIIEEDGIERPVSVFEAVTTNNKRLAKTPRTNEFNNINADEAPRSMMLIVIDAINTPFGYQEASRKEVLKFLSRNMSATQLTGLVIMTSKGIRLVHDFTGNSESLALALQQVSGERSHVPIRDLASEQHGANPTEGIGSVMDNRGEPAISSSIGPNPTVSSDSDPAVRDMNTLAKQLTDYLKGEDKVEEFQLKIRIRRTLEAFQQIAQGLAGYPGRKSLIWASASFPAPMDPNRFNDTELMSVYERTMKLLADANVAVYPVDVKGLQTVSPGADASISQYDRLAKVDPGAAYKEAGLKINTFNDFAERTGGRAFFDINNNNKAFQQAYADSGAYYMLGYYVKSTDLKEGWHKLKVKLKGADGKVRTRSGFFFTAAAVDPETSRKNDLNIASRSPFDYNTLLMRGNIINMTGTGPKKRVEFSLQLLPGDNVVDVGNENTVNLDFIAVARKADTTVAGQSAKNIATKLKPEAVAQIQKDGIAFRNAIELEAGEYDVRFLVRDNITGRMGSVLVPLQVK